MKNSNSIAHQSLMEWHAKFGVPIATTSGVPSKERRDLRVSLINEEAKEFQEASENEDLVEAADALADLLYVVYGAALEWGIPLDECFDEVHRSNMTKVWADGTVHYRLDGKVLKPPTYSPAQISKIIEEHSLQMKKRTFLFLEDECLRHDDTYPGIEGWWKGHFNCDFYPCWKSAQATEKDFGGSFERVIPINGRTLIVTMNYDGYKMDSDGLCVITIKVEEQES